MRYGLDKYGLISSIKYNGSWWLVPTWHSNHYAKEVMSASIEYLGQNPRSVLKTLCKRKSKREITCSALVWPGPSGLATHLFSSPTSTLSGSATKQTGTLETLISWRTKAKHAYGFVLTFDNSFSIKLTPPRPWHEFIELGKGINSEK